MRFRYYPGFSWYVTTNGKGESLDHWESLFSNNDVITHIEGKFYVNILSLHNVLRFNTIHEAMEHIRNKAIVNYFDN
jgi:uncharacterized protein (DUF608 family)